MTLWYLARAAGLSALVALSVATALGALGSARSSAIGRRVVVQYMHRAAAVLGLVLLVGHITALVLDQKSGISLAAVAIPFTSSYRPVAVALGTIAAYLVVLVSVVGAARGRMTTSPRAVKVWRGIHLSAYAMWAIAVLHGFLAGSDAGSIWVRSLDVALIVMVLGCLAVRLKAQSVLSQSPLAQRRTLTSSGVAR